MARSRPATRWLQLAVWLGAVAATLWLLPHARPRSPIIGYIDTLRHAVTTPSDGLLQTLTVDVNVRVKQGQVIGRLAADELQLRLAAARFELEQLRADLAYRDAELQQQAQAAAAELRIDVAVESRRLHSAVEDSRVDELETQTELEEAKILLQGATIEVERQAKLEGAGILAEEQATELRTRQQALQRRITELTAVLAEQRARTEAARQRLARFQAEQPALLSRDLALEPLRWQLKAKQAELERIALDATRLDILSPCDGWVEAVHFRPGQWIEAGGSLVTVVEPGSRYILAYVPETMRDQLEGAQVMQVVRVRRPGPARRAKVIGVSPALVLVPSRLWRDPRQEEWAWQVMLETDGDEAPGERVNVLLAGG
jgi:multidrug resistance efflux pump